MAYVIEDSCTKCSACVEVCPVNCIYSTADDDQYFINPEECIECATCVPECPVDAIHHQDEIPAELEEFVDSNANYDYSSASNQAGL